MSAPTPLTQVRETDRQDGEFVDRPVEADAVIHKGSTVLLRAATKLGFTNDGSTNTLALDLFGGIALESVDATGAVAGAKKFRVYANGLHLLNFADTLTIANVGSTVYVNNVTNDAEVTITADATADEYNLAIGTIVEFVNAGTAYVRIDQHIGAVATQNPHGS